MLCRGRETAPMKKNIAKRSKIRGGWRRQRSNYNSNNKKLLIRDLKLHEKHELHFSEIEKGK